MLGTDIFCRLGLDTAAAARPGETAWTTVIGFIMAPEPLLLGLRLRVIHLEGTGIDSIVL